MTPGCLQAIFTSADVVQVNLAAATGDMGILANHAPTIEPLRPGVVEVIEGGNTSKKWFGTCSLCSMYTVNAVTLTFILSCLNLSPTRRVPRFVYQSPPFSSYIASSYIKCRAASLPSTRTTN